MITVMLALMRVVSSELTWRLLLLVVVVIDLLCMAPENCLKDSRMRHIHASSVLRPEGMRGLCLRLNHSSHAAQRVLDSH